MFAFPEEFAMFANVCNDFGPPQARAPRREAPKCMLFLRKINGFGLLLGGRSEPWERRLRPIAGVGRSFVVLLFLRIFNDFAANVCFS